MADVEYYKLLSLEDVAHYLANANADTRQNIITSVMMTTVIVHDKSIYFLDVVNRYFKKISDYSNVNLASLVSQFVGVSLTVLNKEDAGALKRVGEKYPKDYAKLVSYKCADVGSFKLKMSLPEGLQFNVDLGGIHFINGRFDLASGTFNARPSLTLAEPRSLISEVLPYEWSESHPDSEAAFRLIISRLFANTDELEYVLFVLGGALRGDVSGCSCMFHVGRGSNGKTALLRFVSAALSLYSQELPSNVFDSRTVANRVLSEVRPTSRFLIVHELNKNKKDASAIKSVCDGQIVTTKLYKGGAFTIPINGKLFCTTNNIIAFDDDDGGIARRVQYCVHSNIFTTDPTLVNNVNVFAAVMYQYDTMSNENRLAIFNVLRRYATDEFITRVGTNYVIPQSIKTSDSIMDIVAFLRVYYVCEVDGTVSKATVVAHAAQYFIGMEYSEELLIGKICKCEAINKIVYDKHRTLEAGSKGVFVNMRLI